jgi:uncharacterized membrane protein
MRFVGITVGLVAGIVLAGLFGVSSEAWFFAIVGAVVGAIWLPKWASKKAPLVAQEDFENAPAPVIVEPVKQLQERVAELEQRVAALEATLAQGVKAADTSANTSANAKVAASAAPVVVAAARVPMVPTLPAVPNMPVPKPDSVPLAAASAQATQSVVVLPAPLQPPPKPPIPVYSIPEPLPPVPLRERLPAPLAKLIFGGNMLVKAGALILFLGLAFLLRYTAERVTVPIELRYASVALVGAGLLLVGWLLRRKRPDYAIVLKGAGIGVFYLTTLAAMKLHGLLPATAGFAFLFAVAVLSAMLAVLQNAPVLAIVAALEGFAAPVLASTGENHPVGLFTYLLVLDVGIFLVAWFKAWRVLNLIGAVGTFTLAAGWAQKMYTDDQFGVVQPFLVVFFVLFTAIGLLFARRTLLEAPVDSTQPLATRAKDTLRRVGRVDSGLVFGVPMAAFGMQYLLVRPWDFGAAFSALGFGAFYLVLGRLVFSTQPKGLSLLAEAYAIVGVIFATLAIPLGFEGQWTGAAWAVEAAGMYWLGVRQARPYARAFAFAVLTGAVVKLLDATALNGAPGEALLQGSLVGPLLVAGGAFAMWVMHRRGQLDTGAGAEATAGVALPWVGMAALTLLLWQLCVPTWAAVATAALASAVFALSVRKNLLPLTYVTYGMQSVAVAGFVATLHRSTDVDGSGIDSAVSAASATSALASGWQGAVAAGLIGISVLGSVAWSMVQRRRIAQERRLQPEWSMGNKLAVLTGVGLLHLAMLFQINLQQAALLWPISACVVLWVALRMAHPAMALQAAALQVLAALIYLNHGDASAGDAIASNAFATLDFWTPVVLGLAALLCGDWVRGQAKRLQIAFGEEVGVAKATGEWFNHWCDRSRVLWIPVVWGLFWWLQGVLIESGRVLRHLGHADALPAAYVALVLLTSVVAFQVAQRRDWSQLRRATLATLPGFVLVALCAVVSVGQGETNGLAYVPSNAWGWLAWPLALAWHLRLLKGLTPWAGVAALQRRHVAGFWFFLALAARECQWQWGRLGDDWSTWSLLGWVLMPALALWGLQSRPFLQRWPVVDYRRAYLKVAAFPVAVYLLGWAWLTNAVSAGSAAPLPYLPLLNPLELAHWLVLAAVLLWWRALGQSAFAAVPESVGKGIAALTALAMLTGMVLRSCHHYADVPWAFDALYASRLTQAALSVTWAVCGVLVMVLGHSRAMRPVWVAGASLLGVVVVKLFFVELADQGGLFRIVSFLSVGVLLLVVGYFAPVPPAKVDAVGESEPENTGAVPKDSDQGSVV